MKLVHTGTVLIIAATALAGCTVAGSEPTPTTTPTPAPTVHIDTSKHIGEQVDPVNTVWSGTDSGGDLTTFTLHADGTVAVSYSNNTYDYPGDTWRVEGGVLKIEVYLDANDGLAEYVATYSPESKTLDATMRTTKTAKELTVTLSQK
ncbi:MAG: hypothetical protein ABIW81_05100 [Terrimesophilobacter sp.]